MLSKLFKFFFILEAQGAPRMRHFLFKDKVQNDPDPFNKGLES